MPFRVFYLLKIIVRKRRKESGINRLNSVLGVTQLSASRQRCYPRINLAKGLILTGRGRAAD